jgi:Fructose-1,6-bisphosphatase
MIPDAAHAIERVRGDLLIDGQIASCGDDLALVMTHEHGIEAQAIHAFAWEVFQTTTGTAREPGLYGAGQDLLSDAFSGNLRGMGPGYAELEFEERPSEPVLCRSTVLGLIPTRSWTTCGVTGGSSRTGCRSTRWSTRRCRRPPRSWQGRWEPVSEDAPAYAGSR